MYLCVYVFMYLCVYVCVQLCSDLCICNIMYVLYMSSLASAVPDR